MFIFSFFHLFQKSFARGALFDFFLASVFCFFFFVSFQKLKTRFCFFEKTCFC